MKKIKIRTIKDIHNAVNEGNLENFLTDFKSYLSIHLVAKKIAENEEGMRIESDNSVFNWIDDGKNDIDLKIKVREE